MNRIPQKVRVRADIWHNPDGTTTEVVRLFGGPKSLSVSYEQIPELLTRLDQLEREHHERQLICESLTIGHAFHKEEVIDD